MSKEVIADLNELIWQNSLDRYGSSEMEELKSVYIKLSDNELKKQISGIQGFFNSHAYPNKAAKAVYLAALKVKGNFSNEPEQSTKYPSNSLKDIDKFLKSLKPDFNDILQEEFSHGWAFCISHMGRQTNRSSNERIIRILTGTLKSNQRLYVHPMILCNFLGVDIGGIQSGSPNVKKKVHEYSLKLMD